MGEIAWDLIPVYDKKTGEVIEGRWEYFPGGLLDEDIPVYEYHPFHPISEADTVDAGVKSLPGKSG